MEHVRKSRAEREKSSVWELARIVDSLQTGRYKDRGRLWARHRGGSGRSCKKCGAIRSLRCLAIRWTSIIAAFTERSVADQSGPPANICDTETEGRSVGVHI